jgi:hypothetical protein
MTPAYTLMNNRWDEDHTQRRFDALAILIADHLNRHPTPLPLRNTTGRLGTESGAWKWNPNQADPMQATCDMVANRCRHLLPAGMIEQLNCARVSSGSELIELTVTLKIIAHTKLKKKTVRYFADPLHWHFQLKLTP